MFVLYVKEDDMDGVFVLYVCERGWRKKGEVLFLCLFAEKMLGERETRFGLVHGQGNSGREGRGERDRLL